MFWESKETFRFPHSTVNKTLPAVIHKLPTYTSLAPDTSHVAEIQPPVRTYTWPLAPTTAPRLELVWNPTFLTLKRNPQTLYFSKEFPTLSNSYLSFFSLITAFPFKLRIPIG